MNRLWAALAMVFAAFDPASAGEPMSYVYYREVISGGVDRNHYLWDVMREALERTRGAYGDYVLTAVAYTNEKRRLHDLEQGGPGGIDVSLDPPQPELDDKLIAVRIPVDLGLLGYRVMLIQSKDQPRFNKVASLEELRKFTFGVVPWWVDNGILQNSRLPVVEGASFPGMFKMLGVGRFDAFSRSVAEILVDYDLNKQDLPQIAVERHLLIHYPMPYYFWFSKTEEGRLRAERIRAGMASMVADGTLREMFHKEYDPVIKRLDLDHRVLIELPNPLLGPDDPVGDTRLWYRPGAR